MTKLKITRFVDGGHSWFSVKRSLLKALNIEKEISSCSYQKGDSVYLEEDCDAAIFFKAYLKASDLSWEMIKAAFDVKDSYKDSSPVRNYAHYSIDKLNKSDLKDGMKVSIGSKIYTIRITENKRILVRLDENSSYYSVTQTTIDSMQKLPLIDALNEAT